MDKKMEQITTELAEHICDNLCKYPCQISDQEKLEDVCMKCKMADFICKILNTHNAK